MAWQQVGYDNFGPVRGTDALTGYTTSERRIRAGINLKNDDPTRKTGLASIVSINRDTISRLEKLAQIQFPDPDTRNVICSLELHLAVVFCHELIHALDLGQNFDLLQRCLEHRRILTADPSHKSNYPHSNEPFYNPLGFKTQTLAEMGYCWENEVFGGEFKLGIDGDYRLFIVKWPTFDTDITQLVPKRRGFKKTSTRWIVPMYYI